MRAHIATPSSTQAHADLERLARLSSFELFWTSGRLRREIYTNKVLTPRENDVRECDEAEHQLVVVLHVDNNVTRRLIRVCGEDGLEQIYRGHGRPTP